MASEWINIDQLGTLGSEPDLMPPHREPNSLDVGMNVRAIGPNLGNAGGYLLVADLPGQNPYCVSDAFEGADGTKLVNHEALSGSWATTLNGSGSLDQFELLGNRLVVKLANTGIEGENLAIAEGCVLNNALGATMHVTGSADAQDPGSVYLLLFALADKVSPKGVGVRVGSGVMYWGNFGGGDTEAAVATGSDFDLTITVKAGLLTITGTIGVEVIDISKAVSGYEDQQLVIVQPSPSQDGIVYLDTFSASVP